MMAIAERKPLGQLLRRPPRYGINAAAVPLSPSVPTYIRITDIDASGRFAPDPKVGVSHPNASDYRLSAGELVFARTGASVGKSYLYNVRDGELVYAGFLINIAPDPKRLNPKYLSLFTQSKEYWDWVARTSARSGQPGVNGREYAQLLVPLPDVATQDTIAKAMTDVDDLIATLERLETKKQAMKKGMTQQLLTGESRLPGFVEDWNESPMHSLGSTYGGLTGKTKEDFSSGAALYIPFMAVMSSVHVTSRSLLSVRVAEGERQNTVKPGDLLFNASSETPDELAMCAVAENLPDGTYLNSFCFGFRISSTDEANPLFLAYLFRSGVGRQLMSVLAQGAIRYNLSKAAFRNVVVTLPCVDEQRAISHVLRDVDREIDTLRKRLRKARAIKQGMVQQILPGRTPLAVAEEVA